LPDGARDAAGWATARAHAIMAAHKRESLQNEAGLRGTRRWATRVEEHEELLGLRRLDAPHGTGCEPELSSPLTQHQMSGLQIAP